MTEFLLCRAPFVCMVHTSRCETSGVVFIGASRCETPGVMVAPTSSDVGWFIYVPGDRSPRVIEL